MGAQNSVFSAADEKQWSLALAAIGFHRTMLQSSIFFFKLLIGFFFLLTWWDIFINSSCGRAFFGALLVTTLEQ